MENKTYPLFFRDCQKYLFWERNLKFFCLTFVLREKPTTFLHEKLKTIPFFRLVLLFSFVFWRLPKKTESWKIFAQPLSRKRIHLACHLGIQ